MMWKVQQCASAISEASETRYEARLQESMQRLKKNVGREADQERRTLTALHNTEQHSLMTQVAVLKAQEAEQSEVFAAREAELDRMRQVLADQAAARADRDQAVRDKLLLKYTQQLRSGSVASAWQSWRTLVSRRQTARRVLVRLHGHWSHREQSWGFGRWREQTSVGRERERMAAEAAAREAEQSEAMAASNFKMIHGHLAVALRAQSQRSQLLLTRSRVVATWRRRASRRRTAGIVVRSILARRRRLALETAFIALRASVVSPAVQVSIKRQSFDHLVVSKALKAWKLLSRHQRKRRGSSAAFATSVPTRLVRRRSPSGFLNAADRVRQALGSLRQIADVSSVAFAAATASPVRAAASTGFKSAASGTRRPDTHRTHDSDKYAALSRQSSEAAAAGHGSSRIVTPELRQPPPSLRNPGALPERHLRGRPRPSGLSRPKALDALRLAASSRL